MRTSSSLSQTLSAKCASVRLWLHIAISTILVLGAVSAQAQVSYVDYSLSGSQKYVLRVAPAGTPAGTGTGQPFLLNAIQVRLDKVRYWSTYLWSWTDCQALVNLAAADGFNTVSIPVNWYEIETSEGTFNWTILDNYMSYAKAANIKMEIIWTGTNSDGTVEWLGDSVNPVHLRTPDYVLYSPSYGSTATTSNYTIDTKFNPYTLVDTNTSLQAREAYVVGQMMNHIASWDSSNSYSHTVVGIQIENEMNGGDYNSAADVIGYINAVADAVKSSHYSVWTRANEQDSTSLVTSLVDYNESLGSSSHLDFIGRDDYSNSVTNIQAAMPLIGKNFQEIMENSGENPFEIRLAALAGNTALGTYDMCGPDAGEGLYDQTANNSGTCSEYSNIDGDVIANLLMLDQDPVDLAINAQGSGLFVHNWNDSGDATTGGTLGITYTPTSANDEGISIKRSSTQIVLMNTKGGTFTFPSSITITSAQKGYFNSSNVWVDQGNVSYSSHSITPAAFTTVLLTY
jgi:hypothetical protein